MLRALEDLWAALQVLGGDDVLDEKLAEYAFFPLSHVFNESQRLSARCLEVAVRCLQILVTRGWRVKLSPEMGKQLLILMTLLAGGSPAHRRTEAPGDDLKVAAFDCMSALAECMGRLQRSRPVFDEVGARTIVDQSIYLLLEAITDSPSDLVQFAAAHALSSLLDQISNRVVLASLLPRTVSAITKALLPSTQARRTHKVLEVHLEILTKILYEVLNDEVAVDESSALLGTKRLSATADEHEADKLPILDQSWLQATSSQVTLALASVVKLRNHGRAEVRQALLQLAITVIERCSTSLADCVPLMVETLVVLANDRESTTAFSTLRRLATAEPALGELLQSSLHKWTASLPRYMQSSDDTPKERILQQISTTFEVLAEIDQTSDVLETSLATNLVQSVAAAIGSSTSRPTQAVTEPAKPLLDLINIHDPSYRAGFEAVVLNHVSQKDSVQQLQKLIANLGRAQVANALIRSILDYVPSSVGDSKLAAIWLALNFLRQAPPDQPLLDEYLDIPADVAPPGDLRPYLVSDLYSLTVSELVDRSSNTDTARTNWRLTALVLESLILQADQLGSSYRPELIETLYPLLSLLGAPQPELRIHAMTALNLLARACRYSSAADMLVQNVDYLINSVALKLNTFDISPQAPHVLLMMIRLCGSKLIPYLDDLIGDIFAALDSFHGYPRLVEVLFEVLGAVVDEGARQPSMAITNRKDPVEHKKHAYQPSIVDDIVTDLRSYKARKTMADADHVKQVESAPHRPWKDAAHDLDNAGPQSPNRLPEEEDNQVEAHADEDLPPREKEQPLSKSHTLLLRVAESTPYHLSSPSPSVRLTILQLISRVATPLSADENTFLPLINALWPALAPRVFTDLPAADDIDEEGGGGGGGRTESTYVVTAAANAVSALCIAAGDFMASRIEDIFPSLERKYTQVWGRVVAKRQRERGKRRDQRVRMLNKDTRGAALTGTVDLDLRIAQTNMSSAPIRSPNSSIEAASYHSASSSDEQILNALIGLLCAIVENVRITDDMGDVILELLAPVMDDAGRERVSDVLQGWNADAVWLVRQHMRVFGEEDDG